jgi:hypothetical protein
VSDVVVYQQKTSLELAPEAWTLATRIAGTEFVPAALRGKPEAVLAAILTGHELGIPPMQSLAKIHVVDGRPAMAAELMRALILREGHEIWVEEATTTRCTIVGKRAGSTHESRVTWTLDDAKRAGLDGKKNWRTYPGDMLLARATSKLARLLFADVIAGVSYSVEELTDGDELADGDTGGTAGTAASGKPKGTRRRASRAATAKAAAEPEPNVAPVVAEVVDDVALPLPGEDGYVGEFDQVEGVEFVDGEGTAASSTGGGPVPDGGTSAGPPPGSSDGGEPTGLPARSGPEPGDAVESGSDSGTASPPSDGSPTATARARHIAIACREIGIEKDEHRHAFIALVTDGRASSGKQLDDVDFALVQECIGRVKDGRLRLVHQSDGGLRIEEVGEPAAGTASDDEAFWSADRWREFLKVHGVTQVAALRHARAVAEELGVEPPGGFAEWTDGRISAAVRQWVEDR